MYKRQYFILGTVIVLLLTGAFFLRSLPKASHVPHSSQLITPSLAPKDKVSYNGENGKTAEVLLKEKTKGNISYDASGMVSGIMNRVADTKKREYWAFYVNNKLSSMGAASYITSDSDTITWKIETY